MTGEDHGWAALSEHPSGDEDDRLDEHRARSRNGTHNNLLFEFEPDDETIRWRVTQFVDPLVRRGLPGLFPDMMAESLSASGPGDRTFTYDLIDPEEGSFTLSIRGHNEDGLRVWLHTPVIQINDKAVISRSH